jgi:hypothetical protein
MNSTNQNAARCTNNERHFDYSANIKLESDISIQFIFHDYPAYNRR